MVKKTNAVLRDRSSMPTKEELVALIGKPPMLKTESVEQFFALFDRFSAALEPRDIIDATSVWFYTIKTFELIRAHRFKIGILERARAEAIYSILDWICSGPIADPALQAKIGEIASTPFHKPGKARDQLLEFLATYDIDEEAINAEAVKLCLHEIETIDRSIAPIEAGRHAIVREMLFYRHELRPRFRELDNELPALIEQAPPLLPSKVGSEDSPGQAELEQVGQGLENDGEE